MNFTLISLRYLCFQGRQDWYKHKGKRVKLKSTWYDHFPAKQPHKKTNNYSNQRQHYHQYTSERQQQQQLSPPPHHHSNHHHHHPHHHHTPYQSTIALLLSAHTSHSMNTRATPPRATTLRDWSALSQLKKAIKMSWECQVGFILMFLTKYFFFGSIGFEHATYRSPQQIELYR